MFIHQACNEQGQRANWEKRLQGSFNILLVRVKSSFCKVLGKREKKKKKNMEGYARVSDQAPQKRDKVVLI